jgi:hypothetical protein
MLTSSTPIIASIYWAEWQKCQEWALDKKKKKKKKMLFEP